jgi:hypothetical protein
MNGHLLSLSDQAKTVKLGIYSHFKGGKYEVIGVGRDSEDPTNELVVYRSPATQELWVRPLKMFLENVERDGYNGPRFVFIK